MRPKYLIYHVSSFLNVSTICPVTSLLFTGKSLRFCIPVLQYFHFPYGTYLFSYNFFPSCKHLNFFVLAFQWIYPNHCLLYHHYIPIFCYTVRSSRFSWNCQFFKIVVVLEENVEFILYLTHYLCLDEIFSNIKLIGLKSILVYKLQPLKLQNYSQIAALSNYADFKMRETYKKKTIPTK